MFLDGNETEFCEKILSLLAKVCDLQFTTVQKAGKELGIPTEQINHLLNRNLKDVRVSTLLTIASKAGYRVKVEVTEVPHE